MFLRNSYWRNPPPEPARRSTPKSYALVKWVCTSRMKYSPFGHFSAVAAGYYHSLALRSDGRVLAWGRNEAGELGDGTTTDRHVPTLVPDLTDVVAIDAQ